MQTRAAARSQARQEAVQPAKARSTEQQVAQPVAKAGWGDYFTWSYWKGRPVDEL